MALEIERKFLLASDAWTADAGPGVRYRQGYLCSDPSRVVRVRTAGDTGYLTVKGAGEGIARLEFEYPIPRADADELLDRICPRPLIEKTRYRVPHGGVTWEIDVFEGENAGLVVAEVELSSPDQRVVLPAWIGREVTGDVRYYNANLGRSPYKTWGDHPAPG